MYSRCVYVLIHCTQVASREPVCTSYIAFTLAYALHSLATITIAPAYVFFSRNLKHDPLQGLASVSSFFLVLAIEAVDARDGGPARDQWSDLLDAMVRPPPPLSLVSLSIRVRDTHINACMHTRLAHQIRTCLSTRFGLVLDPLFFVRLVA